VQSGLSNRVFRTRSGALVAGIVAAVLAAILLLIYLKSYRSSVNSGKQLETVLVAKRTIPKGTPGGVVAQKGYYQVTSVRKDQLEPLAITNPGTLSGQIAAHDINPGAQLTADDFTSTGAGELQYQLIGRQRAISIPVDETHGLIGQLAAGDNVDVYVAVGGGTQGGSGGQLVKLLADDIEVLVAPGTGTGTGSNGSSSTVLRVTGKQAGLFAYAAQYEQMYLVLRPQVGSSKTPPSVVTLASLLKSRG
jgi:Flp pilus assembly protein CpaB